jgi:hypothetical protein
MLGLRESTTESEELSRKDRHEQPFPAADSFVSDTHHGE